MSEKPLYVDLKDMFRAKKIVQEAVVNSSSNLESATTTIPYSIIYLEADARRTWEQGSMRIKEKLMNLANDQIPFGLLSPRPGVLGGVRLRDRLPIYITQRESRLAEINRVLASRNELDLEQQRSLKEEQGILTSELELLHLSPQDAHQRLGQREQERERQILTALYPAGPTLLQREGFEHRVAIVRRELERSRDQVSREVGSGGSLADDNRMARLWHHLRDILIDAHGHPRLTSLLGALALGTAAVLTGSGLPMSFLLGVVGLIGGRLIDGPLFRSLAPTSPTLVQTTPSVNITSIQPFPPGVVPPKRGTTGQDASRPLSR